MTKSTRPELPFKRLGEYEILAPIAEGGMATVWLGRSTVHPEELVALKVIRPEHSRNKEFVAMFRDEAQIASRLSHPNIIKIHGLGHDGKRYFLAMEVLRGRSLLDLWQLAHARGKRIPYEVVAWIGARIGDALEHAHGARDEHGAERQVVHRDVNPSNIFLTSDGVPRLIDFGLAKARDRLSATAVGVLKGKLAYLAPEQAHGKPADRRADVFALGVTLWEISLDRRLFREDSDVETVRRVREGQVPDPVALDADYPPQLRDAVMRALAVDPAERWQTAGALRDALDVFVREREVPVDAARVRTLMEELAGPRVRPEWERLVDEASVGSERIRVWDDERQKLTWMNASLETMLPDAASGPGPESAPPPATLAERLDRALADRVARLDPAHDGVARARAHLERALVSELLGDGTNAATYAAASLAASPSSAAHGVLRRVGHTRKGARALLPHLDAELAECANDAVRASLLAERARVLEAVGESLDARRAAWERVLAVEPQHPAALRGLEAALTADPSARAALAAHLGRMAEACEGEPALAAWHHAERARLLDVDLGQPDAAKAALTRALELDPGLGPVRAACVAHAVAHRDSSWLVELLEREAALERDAARAAALEVDAACLARDRLGDASRAIALLERAASRAGAAVHVRRRALDDLVTLHEAAGHTPEALRVRASRLGMRVEPRAQAHEQRAIAALQEALGDRRAAAAVLERALELTPDDVALAEELDRLFETQSMTERRIDLWTRLAAATPDAAERARRLVRAARLAESLGDGARAVDTLSAALVAQPADVRAIDGLLRLLSSPRSEAAIAEARARIAVHVHAAEHAVDPARRLAHLEAIALLEEEMIGAPARAVAAYEAVLRLEGDRRSAVLGLARNAERAGDGEALARALLLEAAAAADPRAADDLRVRAAEALASRDAERALALVREVLARTSHSPDARRLEQRIHEAAGRWAQVDVVLSARIEHEASTPARVDLWLARAELQRARLRAPGEALASLRAALELDPAHPAVREALVAQLEALGDARALRDGLVELAQNETTAETRAGRMLRAGEIDELILLDDAHAAALYARALGELPGDAWIEEHRARLAQRQARPGHAADLLAILQARLDAAPANPARAFELAQALLDFGGDVARATSLVETVLAQAPAAPHALRVLERVARTTGAAALLGNALDQQAGSFRAPTPRLAALWAEEALVEWTLPDADPAPILERILEHTPGDRAALDATVRLSLPAARTGDSAARARLIGAWRTLLAQTASDIETAVRRLALAMTLEPGQGARAGDDARGALGEYREALRIDPRSLLAAEGTARMAALLGDAEATVAASLSQADLAPDARQRATALVRAAGLLLSAQDARLGERPERLSRASETLERALDADPEALPAVGLLIAARTEEGARDRLLDALRAAFERVRSDDVVVHLGSEVARIAALPPAHHVLAIEALRRVLAVAPRHAPTLRMLADQYVQQGAWAEAVEALEALAAQARDAQARLAALFQLADVYTNTLHRAGDAERVLRAALDVDPANLDALRRLLAHLRAAGADASEIAKYLARMADAEGEPAAKAAALDELAESSLARGDAGAGERALVEATAQAPTPERLARVLALHPGAPAEQARVLAAVVTRSEELERPHPATLAGLGQLEVGLGRWRDGVAHLRVAVGLAPALDEARAALAAGLTRLRGAAEAIGTLVPMLVPDASPLLSLRDPAGALATLEIALDAEGRRDEALVARELRAVAGGLDDGAHVALRARRLAIDPRAPIPVALDPATLRAGVLPHDTSRLLLDLATALVGAEDKLAHVDRDEAGIGPRDRLAPTGGHPLLVLVHRLATMLAVPRPEIAIVATAAPPRIVLSDGPWLVVPESLLEQQEPTQTAALVRPLVRLALAVPWLDALRGPYAQAVLCAAARQVDPGFASDLPADPLELVEDFTKRVGRAVGRRNKKALAELAPALAQVRGPTLADIAAFEQAIARAELRAAFVLTGDFLATLDSARALDADLERATADVGPAALAAILRDPLTSDVARFALSPAATALRWRAGTVWPAA